MTNIVALVRAWLAGDSGVAALCGPRVSSTLDPADGFPAIVIGAVSGGPQSIASAQVDRVERWSIALYVHAGRLAGGASDLPDSQTAWDAAQAAVAAVKSLDVTPYDGPLGCIAAGRVVSVAPGRDFDTGNARVTVTLELLVVRVG